MPMLGDSNIKIGNYFSEYFLFFEISVMVDGAVLQWFINISCNLAIQLL